MTGISEGSIAFRYFFMHPDLDPAANQLHWPLEYHCNFPEKSDPASVLSWDNYPFKKDLVELFPADVFHPSRQGNTPLFGNSRETDILLLHQLRVKLLALAVRKYTLLSSLSIMSIQWVTGCLSRSLSLITLKITQRTEV